MNGMMKSRGIILVVYGMRFDTLAAHTMSYSRKNTNLPITIVTNISETQRHRLWFSISNINFIYRNEPDNKNRFIKLQLYKYTPYEETIYMDIDAVIQNKGIENIFSALEDSAVLLCPYGTFITQRNLLSAYEKAYRMLREKLPVRIYYGAVIVFKKCQDTINFFDAWLNNWRKSKVKREMPALSVTVKRNPGLKISEISVSKEFFSWRVNKNCIIQHEYGNGADFWQNFSISRGLNWNFRIS